MEVKFRKGDYIKCIKPPTYMKGISLGTIYKVDKFEQNSSTSGEVWIYNDEGEYDWFAGWRFELAEDYILKQLWS